MTTEQQAEHQRDLDTLTRAENARDQLQRDLAAERAAHTSLKQLIRENLESDDQECEPESVLVIVAGAVLRTRRAPTVSERPVPLAHPVREGDMSDDELKDELQRIDTSEDDYRTLSFRDHAFLQSLAGTAIDVVRIIQSRDVSLVDATDPVIAAAKEIAKQSDKARDKERMRDGSRTS